MHDRCAHLHLRQKLQAMPGLATQLPDAIAALEQAHAAVEAGQLEDHPKQQLLQKLLAAIAALAPVSAPEQCHMELIVAAQWTPA